jgi:hypothetical protein
MRVGTNGQKQSLLMETKVPDLRTEQLITLLAQLDEMIRQARELSGHIKTQLDARRNPIKPALNWGKSSQRTRAT